MTPEELAAEYLKNLAKKRIPFTYLNVNEQIKQAFLAGLKERADKADLDSALFFSQLCDAKKLLTRWVSDKPYTVSEQKDLIIDTEQFLEGWEE